MCNFVSKLTMAECETDGERVKRSGTGREIRVWCIQAVTPAEPHSRNQKARSLILSLEKQLLESFAATCEHKSLFVCGSLFYEITY